MPTSVLVVCTRHPNCGCEIASCCFTCPLPDCAYVGPMRAGTADKYHKIKGMRDRGMTSTEISQELDVSLRTVWRALNARR